MSAGRTLLVLQDSPAFGGHELMFLKLLPAVLDDDYFDRVIVRMPASNQNFRERLGAVAAPRLIVRPWDFEKGRGEPYLAGFRHRYRAEVSEMVAREQPHATLLLQGRIENLAVPMLTIPPSRFVVSYIPMAHRLEEMGRSGTIGNQVRRRLYRRPDRFVVPSQAVARQLTRAGGRSPAVVVENVVDAAPARADCIRARIGVAQDRRIALFIGRFDSGQKGLDILIDAIRRSAPFLGDWTFLFVGEGPGRAEIETLGQATGAAAVDYRILPWAADPSPYFASSDILLMPSRFEGVPLVMLESMTHGLPMLTSDLDVFADYLPPENRADFASLDLADRLETLVRSDRATAYRRIARERVAGMSLQSSRRRFVHALQPELVH